MKNWSIRKKIAIPIAIIILFNCVALGMLHHEVLKVSKELKKSVEGVEINIQALLHEVNQVEVVTTALGIISIILAIIFTFIITHSIIKPITQLIEDTKKFGEGDLSKKVIIDSKDELNQLGTQICKMRLNTINILEEIKHLVADIEQKTKVLDESSSQTTTATEGVASLVEGFSTSTVDTSMKSQDISVHLNDTVMRLQKGVQEVKKALEVSDESLLYAENGKDEINQAISSLNHLKQGVMGDMVNSTLELQEDVKTVGNVISFIKDMADQTNLLALNASIEAARAGEHGKGFAVVATEVRKLSEETNHSAAKIVEFMDRIDSKTDYVSELISHSIKQFDSNLEKMEQGSGIFADITEKARQTKNSVTEVNTVFEDIQTSSGQINTAVTSIAQEIETSAGSSEELSATTQEIFTMMEHVHASSQEIKESVDTLNKKMSHFRLA